MADNDETKPHSPFEGTHAGNETPTTPDLDPNTDDVVEVVEVNEDAPSFGSDETVVTKPSAAPPPIRKRNVPPAGRHPIENPDDFEETVEDKVKKLQWIAYGAIAVAVIALLINFIFILSDKKVSASDLEDGSVTSAKIADGAVGSDSLDNSAIKNQVGKTGPTGEQGPIGPPGKSAKGGGAPKTTVVIAQTPLIATKTKEIEATCPAGKSITGGGASIGGEGVAYIRASGPKTPENNAPTTWRAEAVADKSNTAPWRITATVVCVDKNGVNGAPAIKEKPARPIKGLNAKGFN